MAVARNHGQGGGTCEHGDGMNYTILREREILIGGGGKGGGGCLPYDSYYLPFPGIVDSVERYT